MADNKNETINETLREGLALYEASVKRQQVAKPKFKPMFDVELANIAEARRFLLETFK